jgi:hypothetical protein
MLDLVWLDELATRLEETRTFFQTLRRTFTGLLRLDGDDLQSRLIELKDAASAAEARSHHPHSVDVHRASNAAT